MNIRMEQCYKKQFIKIVQNKKSIKNVILNIQKQVSIALKLLDHLHLLLNYKLDDNTDKKKSKNSKKYKKKDKKIVRLRKENQAEVEAGEMDFKTTKILNGIKPKTIEVLILNGITDLNTLSSFKEREILSMKKVGKASVERLKSILKANDLSFME